jgi:hypothetical protein
MIRNAKTRIAITAENFRFTIGRDTGVAGDSQCVEDRFSEQSETSPSITSVSYPTTH